MNKKLFFLEFTIKTLKWIFQVFLNNIPLMLLIFLIIFCISFSEGDEDIKFIFSCLGFSFILCGLTFQKASISEGKASKIYKHIGVLFFHSTLMFIFALVSHFSADIVTEVLKEKTHSSEFYALLILRKILTISFVSTLIFGLLEAGWALHNINGMLFKELFSDDAGIEDQWKLKI